MDNRTHGYIDATQALLEQFDEGLRAGPTLKRDYSNI